MAVWMLTAQFKTERVVNVHDMPFQMVLSLLSWNVELTSSQAAWVYVLVRRVYVGKSLV